MERRVTDPSELEEIYRVDHLAVRMRRYAEDLVILAGAVPGRGWRYPVPLSDVLRSAMSEVEDYTRVSVVSVPEVSLAGRAVSDVIHLSLSCWRTRPRFSPKDTQVRLVGQMLPNGFAVEIEDRGVGMPADDLAEANERLANPPDFDPARSSRLGLFVVARLAARHGVKVSLQSSVYGGITAVALLPNEIIVKKIHEMPALTAAPGRPRFDHRRRRRARGHRGDDGHLAASTRLRLAATGPLTPARTAFRYGRARPTSYPNCGKRRRTGGGGPTPTRPAEHTRSLLSALQAGVSRGRQEAANQDEEEGQ